MARSDTFNVIYLGKHDVIDTFEGYYYPNANPPQADPNYKAEQASKLIGEYNDLTPESVVTFSPDRGANSYNTYHDGTTSQYANKTYDQAEVMSQLVYTQPNSFKITTQDGTSTNHIFDAVALYNGEVTFDDGTKRTGEIAIIQDKVGNTYMVPVTPEPHTDYYRPNIPMSSMFPADKPIQGIKLTSVAQDTFRGYYFANENYNVRTVRCFAAGTLIATDRGLRPVEQLCEGEMVKTRDNGSQPVRWIGCSRVDAGALSDTPSLLPIRILKGALGKGAPNRDLVVSPQHRVLVRSRIAQRMFGTDEVLVAAKHLLSLDGVEVEQPADGVAYYHIMFDRHEIIYSNGLETESLYAGEEAIRGMDDAAREELFTLFPELREEQQPEAARVLTNGRRGRQLAMRHAQNATPLQ
ncbi:Hint domain-containing protein [Paracoccus isoporae]|uniref:Hint domain-containing protein n=1 Tax=Paracoccus isoporae TaxID=591205 RepID=A0A1G6UGW0_9RHOB|nr:Hint domain-containing protein [Paracoccus isoporae]SDD39946.1 Hint domain-containing protein [Paracoccus isoporae]